ncbi:MAG TPA: thiamine pyrophosphate-binding protein, partial [Polyangiaceae bacterium]|nr:thiamine pyrophosphate-binding protein [Polyangiaceae bacterium]
SIPMLILSGQVKRETCMAFHTVPGLRQLGDQEADIAAMVRGITKYVAVVRDPNDILYHLERALALATEGRPGPCWLDIPSDIQAASIDPSCLRRYDPAEDAPVWSRQGLESVCSEILHRLRTASRPVILAGTGIRLANAVQAFQRLVDKLRIPVTTAWTHDIVPTASPYFCGRQGTIGDRAGNFTVQNSDLLLVLGSRLCIRQVGYHGKAFAREAFKIQVDIDPAELQKPTVSIDLPVCCHLLDFISELEKQLDARGDDSPKHADWLAWCKERVSRYPVVQPRHREFHDGINPYHFFDRLSDRLQDDDVLVCANATATIVPFQVVAMRGCQRMFSNSGSASMGWELPAAVGAAIARRGKRVLCLAGDGSIQMNLQELQTIVHHKLPVKVFVLDNAGYLSIRSTQNNFFGRLVGAGPSSGVSFPNMLDVARAFGIPAIEIEGRDFEASLSSVLASQGPCVGVVRLDPQQGFEPRSSSKSLPDGRIVSAPLEDMYPFLERDELRSNLFIEEWKN